MRKRPLGKRRYSKLAKREHINYTSLTNGPQIRQYLNSWNLTTLPYVAKGLLQMWLCLRSWDGRSSRITQIGPMNHVIAMALRRGTQEESMWLHVQRSEMQFEGVGKNTSQVVQTISKSGGGGRSQQMLPSEPSTLLTTWFQPHKTHTSRSQQNTLVLFEALQWVAICDSG